MIGRDPTTTDPLAQIIGYVPLEPDDIEGPPEEIGTGIYRLVTGEVCGNEPEDLTNY